ncbi:MAG: DUF4157 domain-containing protein, partial [Thermodesulfobacteriota bacterium]
PPKNQGDYDPETSARPRHDRIPDDGGFLLSRSALSASGDGGEEREGDAKQSGDIRAQHATDEASRQENGQSQHTDGQSQGLPQHVKEHYRNEFGEEELDKVRVKMGIPEHVRKNAAIDPAAYVDGHTIYFKPGEYDPNSAAGVAQIGHELKHVQQGATTPFFKLRYAWQYLTSPKSGEEAYDDITYEKEAVDFEKRQHDYLQLLNKRGYPRWPQPDKPER